VLINRSTRTIYDRMQQSLSSVGWESLKRRVGQRIMGLDHVEVQLVQVDPQSHASVGVCPPDWPAGMHAPSGAGVAVGVPVGSDPPETDQRRCVIQFGSPHMPPFERARHAAVAVCAGTEFCTFGIGLPFVMSQLAFSWVRERLGGALTTVIQRCGSS